MPPIRFRSRHLHKTFVTQLTSDLDDAGWISPPVNFGAKAITIMDFQPDERSAPIEHNTVAVSLGDYQSDQDEEIGALGGGLRSALYRVFVDVYMSEQSYSLAICDDIRDIYTDRSMPLIDQITLAPVPTCVIEVQEVLGPERPAGSGIDPFRRYWRTMRVDALLYFQS